MPVLFRKLCMSCACFDLKSNSLYCPHSNIYCFIAMNTNYLNHAHESAHYNG